MRRSVWITLGLMLVVVLALWLRPNGDSEEREIVQTVNDKPKPKTPRSVTDKKLTTNEKSSEENGEEFNPYESEVFKAQIQQVADLFEETSRYPVGSRPVTNPDSVREVAPFEHNEVDLPFANDGDLANAIRISAATDTFQYYQGQKITVRVRVSGAPIDTFTGVTGNLSSTRGDLPYPLVFQPTDATLTEFLAEFDTQIVQPELMTPEMVAVVKVKVGDQDMLTTVSFRYDQPSAQVIGTLPSRVEGPNLVIPLQVSVSQTGYYFVRAVLDEAGTSKPLIELQNEGPLTAGNGLLELNAHIAALKYHQSEGPYKLRSIKLHRGAELGEALDVPGSTMQKQFSVQGFPFSMYSDEEFVDELAQERLEFLRQMGAVDEEQVQERISEAQDQ